MSPIKTTVLFCDDVRQEVTNKTTIVGMYRGVLRTTAPGQALPKLVLLALLAYPAQLVGTPIRMLVLEDDKPIIDTEISLPASVAGGAAADEAVVELSAPFELLGYVPRDGVRLRFRLVHAGQAWDSDPLLMRTPAALVAPSPPV